MADIFNPTTGHSFFKVSDELAAILFDLGLVQYVRKAKPTPPAEYACIVAENHTDNPDIPAQRPYIRKRIYAGERVISETLFHGNPENAAAAMPDCPPAVVLAYKRALNPDVQLGPHTREFSEQEEAQQQQNRMGCTATGHTA